MKKNLRLSMVVALGAVLGVAASSIADISVWNVSASTGTPDETSAALLAFTAFNATFQAGKTGTANIRYNVPLLTLNSGDTARLEMTYKNTNAAGDRIVARLKKYNALTGEQTTEAVVDSNSFDSPVAGNLVTNGQTSSSCSTFVAGFYYVLDVALTNSATNAQVPALVGLTVGDSGSGCP
jgi:hypothetical protein